MSIGIYLRGLALDILVIAYLGSHTFRQCLRQCPSTFLSYSFCFFFLSDLFTCLTFLMSTCFHGALGKGGEVGVQA